MNDPHACPKCGDPLPPDAPEGLCPACLMSGGLPTDADAATAPMGDSPRATASQPMAPRAVEDLAPLFPQLEILELLGRGGMGAVYKARQKNLDRFVALKILTIDPAAEGGFGERFHREAKALGRLNHPNIVSVFDFGVIDGLYYFLMEYVDGANLRSLIRGGELKPEAALALIPSFCDALQYAHDEGVVHRDIKPENVLVDKKGRVKIADFGLAKLLGQEHADRGLTLTGMALGTPRYMAPEQLDRPESVDHRADIYSLGVVFYEMLTGEIPMGRFALPSEKVQVDVRFDEIVLRTLERDVERRYQHASEVKTDVQSVVAHPSPPPKNPIAMAAQSAQPAPSAPPDSSASMPLPAATTFLRAMLWLAVVVGAVMFCWFEKMTVHGSNGYSTLRIGAVQPWLVLGDLLVSYAPNFLTVSGFAGIGALIAGIALYCFRQDRRSKSDVGKWRPHEIGFGVVLGLAFLCRAVTGILELSQGYHPANVFEVPVTIAATFGAIGMLIRYQFARPAGARAMLPEFALVVLALCSGGLPWTRLLSDISGTNFWEGAVFSALFLALGLFLLILPGAKWARLRAVALLLSGLIGFALIMLFINLPVQVIGSRGMFGTGVPDVINTKPHLSGVYISTVLSLLISLAGALELRRVLNQTTELPATHIKHPVESKVPRLSRCAIWGAILASLAVCFLLAFLLGRLSTVSRVVGIALPLTATLLGGIAIAQIRNSGGKLHGLPLAIPALLFGPLLLIGAAAGGLVHLAQTALWTLAHTSYSDDGSGRLLNPIAPDPASRPDQNFLILDIAVALIASGFALWLVWRRCFCKIDPTAESNRAWERQSRAPHPCPLALAGAFMAGIGLLAAAVFVWLHFQYYHEIDGKPYRPGDWMRIATALCLVSTGTALAATFLGGLSVSRIKRSDGKLYGLPLAASSALFFPLFILGTLTTFIGTGVVNAVIGLFPAPPGPDGYPPTAAGVGALHLIPLGLIVCFFAARFAWRKISGYQKAERPATAAPAAKPTKRHLLSAGLALLCLFAGLFGLSFQANMKTVPAGLTEIVTIGALDPLYVKESGPSGFTTHFNFFSWSFFAVVVAGIAFGALWRIGREDQGKVPRDPAWWREWWKQVGIWGGLLLVACIVRTAMHPEQVLRPPGERVVSEKFQARQPPAAMPPLGPITSGFGAEFTVPAGQVAIFEIVTRRDNAPVPIPPHGAYVIAPAGEAVNGTFRWSRLPEQDGAGMPRWRIEIVSGAGNGATGGLALPEELDAAVGSMGLSLGLLVPNEEIIHGEGLVGLRITTVAHNLKTGGSGVAHTDWKKANPTQPATSGKTGSN